MTITWQDIAVRLAFAVVSSGIIGYNRKEHGKAAGLRTTMLVCLAATVAMIQADILLPVSGKTPESFGVMDLMRLPLGILTGVGFIGGGAILRHGEMIAGVTTAATLWVVTVIGLCYGGGQLGLGGASTVLTLCALWGFGWLELNMHLQHKAKLFLRIKPPGPSEEDLRRLLANANLRVIGNQISFGEEGREFRFDLVEMRRPSDTSPPAFLKSLAETAGVIHVSWES